MSWEKRYQKRLLKQREELKRVAYAFRYLPNPTPVEEKLLRDLEENLEKIDQELKELKRR